MKKITIAFISSFIVSLLPISQVILLNTSSPFNESYYAELPALKKKLDDNKNNKKIVILGNSSVAFGINSSLLETKLHESGLDYKVCNFGLYGVIGTKAMMELSINSINKDDIVIFAPELYSTSFSLYFSGKEMWYALDANKNYINELSLDSKKSMFDNVISYNAVKYSYLIEGKKASGGDVYTKSSFDENGDLTKANRKENKMNGYYEKTNNLSFDTSLLNDSFINYVNDYYKVIKNKGAEMYYSFAPMNEYAFKEIDANEMKTFYNKLDDKLLFRIITSPQKSIYEPNWFFDTNFHLNESGMKKHTFDLLEDIRNELSITTPIEIDEVTMPDLPKQEVTGTGDNQDISCFVFDENNEIVSLSEEGKKKESIIIPYSYNNHIFTTFPSTLFQNATSLKSITIQRNIKSLPSNAFKGCTSLKSIYIEETNPDEISVTDSLIEGLSNVTIYVPKSSVTTYSFHYYWGHYSSVIKGY